MTDLNTLLEPISRFVATLDAADPKKAEDALNARFPASSDTVAAVAKAAREAVASGAICSRGEPSMRFSRVSKPENTPGGCSIDAVLMDDAAGPAHLHPNGEFCLCIPESGTPTFEGRHDTWIVMKSGSRHVPTVRGGKMLILYWLPAGAVTWG